LSLGEAKKQSVVARSSAEAEYRAIAKGVCELLRLRKLMRELRLFGKKPLSLFSDSKAAIGITHNPIQHDRTKHVEIDRHFIKEKLVEGSLDVFHVESERQLADMFTKRLSNRSFHTIICKLGIRDIFAPT
jgi:hypothetical protein